MLFALPKLSETIITFELPTPPINKAAEELEERETVQEILRAINVWLYENEVSA